MANVEKLTIGSDTYDLRDASAVHTVDSALSSSSTNPVQNKVVYSAIKNQPHFEYVMTSGYLQPTNFSGTFPTTFSALVSHADFKIALRNPVIVHYLSLTGSDDFITQGLLWFGVNTQITDEWTILFPDGVTFQGALTNGVTGTMSYDSSGQVWYLYDVSAHTPGYKTYTDDAIASIPAGSDTTYTFTGGTQSFTATPSQGTAQSVSIKPQIFKGTCSTAAATTAKVVTCPEFTSADLVTGAVIFVLFTNTNSGAVGSITLNVNSTGAKNIKYMRNAAESNLPAVGYLRANMTYRFVYNGTYWVCDTDYDADTVTMLTYRSLRVASDAGGSLYSYKLCALDNNGDLIPFNFVSTDPTTTYKKAITTHAFNPFRGFLYYAGTTTTSAGSVRDANEFRSAVQFDSRYSLNINSSGTAGSTALTAYDPIYVKALYTASTRLAQLVADTEDDNYLVRSSVVQALPSANPNTGLADGTFYIYILLGQVYSKYQIDMFDNNTVYYWNAKAGMMTEFTGVIEANFAQSLHSHGDIDYAGAITTNPGTTIATGDSLLIADSSLGNTIKKAATSFDTTDTSKFFRHDGTFANPVEPYALCGTASGTAAKEANTGTVSGVGSGNGKTVEHTFGQKVLVYFINGNNANSITLNVNGLGAKQVKLHGGNNTAPTNFGFDAGTLVEFVYDNNYWRVLSIDPLQTKIPESGIYTTISTSKLLRPVQLNGSSINGDVTVCGQVDAMRANRLAFLPPEHVIVEQTTDGGTTWVSAGVADVTKRHVFAGTRGSYFSLPRIDGVRNINCGLRVTFTAMNYNVPDGTAETDKYQYWNSTYVASAERYTQLREFYIFCSTVADGLSCLVEAATGANPNTWTTVYNSGSGFALTGWSGSDYIRINGTYTFGGGTNQTSNYWNYRMTFFTRNSTGGTDLSTSSTTSMQQIFQIQGYGPTSWTNPNNMMFKDHLYNWDENKNATFPAALTASELRGLGAAYYGTCATAAATADKVVDCPGFALANGAHLTVRFNNGNTSAGPLQLNVNSTGLKRAYRYTTAGSVQSLDCRCEAGEYFEFVYNGNNGYWVLLTPYGVRDAATLNSRFTNCNRSYGHWGLEYFNATSSMTTGKPPVDGHVLGMHWDSGSLWASQLCVGNGTARLFTRAQNNGTWGSWREAPLLASTPTNGQVIVSDETAQTGQVKGVTLNVDGANFDGTNPVKHYGITTLYSNGVFSIIDANYNNTLAQGFRMTINVAGDMSYDTGLKMNIRTSGTDVPGSGDKFIKRNGEVIKSLTAGEVLEFVYDGTDWQQVGGSGGDADVAEQLGEEVNVTDNVPYIYRPTGGDVLTGTSKYETLVGGTVAWNQLLYGTTPSACTQSISNGIITITPTSSDNRFIAVDPNNSSYIPIINDHVYLQSVVIKSDGTHNVGFQNYRYLEITKKTNSAGWTVLADIKKASASGNSMVQLYSSSQTVYYIKQGSFRLYDLTLMFGPTIANQLLSMETSTAGSGVAWFRDLFPSDYYPYNAGELLSVMPTAEKSIGANQWDEEWEYGEINSTTGANSGSATTAWRTKNYIPVIPGATYYVAAPVTNKNLKARFYDASKNYIGYTNKEGTNCFTTTAFTVPDNASYLRFGPAVSDIAVPNHNICVNISNASYNGTYEPYKESTYPITPVELRGIPKLDSNNKLYYDGDIRNSDGTVTRKYGQSALSALSWQTCTYQSVVYYTAKADSAYTLNADAEIFGYCTAYTINNVPGIVNLSTGQITFTAGTIGSGKTIAVRDDSISSVSELVTKLTGNGEIVFKKKNPTYEEVATFPNPQVVDPYGVEEFVDERTVAMPVGHESRYVTNLREKLEEAPSVPVDDGRYVVETKNGVSNYVREEMKESEGYFLVTDGESSSDTWHYYKVGKQVTVSGLYTGTSSTATSLSELPFTPKYGLKFVLPVMMISPAMRLYFCQVSISANSKTIGTQGHFSDGGSNLTGSWLNIGQIHSTPITFTYITDD